MSRDKFGASVALYRTREPGFSEGAAYNRILVARAARKLPAILEAVREGRVHLAGLRLLAPHLAPENCDAFLARAAERTKDEIAELVAALAPRPPPTASTRKLPEPRPLPLADPPAQARPGPRPIAPVAEETFKLQFAISRGFRDEIREAQTCCATELSTATSPRSFVAPCSCGHRCGETAFLEFDHLEGFARTGLHDVDGIRLLCRAHNQQAAERLYGRQFMRDRIA